MKTFFITAAVVLASSLAMASKARVTSLQGANHLVDVQTTFINPARVGLLNPQMNFEMGAAGTNAEGGIVKKFASGETHLVYFGHQNSSAITGSADLRTDNGFLGQNNPIEAIWGSQERALGVSFSTINNEQSGTKESTLIGKYGFLNEVNEFYAHFQVLSTAEKPNGAGKDKMSAGPRIILGGAKNLGLRYFGQLTIGKGESKPNGASAIDITDNEVVLGLQDRSLKTATTDAYYGAQINFANRDADGTITQALILPVFMGLEHTINSWATFRGSLSQNMLLGYTKDEAVSDKNEGIASNTTVTAGLGFNYSNLVLDGSLAAASNGAINGNQFLTQASVTYNF